MFDTRRTRYKTKDDEAVIHPSDVSKIISPLEKKHPSGVNLRYDALWDDIRHARHQEEDLPQGEWTHDLKKSDWDQVIGLTTHALKHQTKDLQVCLWLTEALYKKYDLSGLSQGLSLSLQIIENFKDSFYPYSKNDPEYRLSPLTWFNVEMTKHLRFQNLHRANVPDKKLFCLWEYEAQLVQRNAKNTISGRQDVMTIIEKNIAETPREFYENNLIHIELSITKSTQIESLIETMYPAFPVILHNLKAKLKKLEAVFKKLIDKSIPDFDPEHQSMNTDNAGLRGIRYLSKKGTAMAIKNGKKDASGAQGNEQERSTFSSKQGTSSRDDAYATLADIAQYLKKIEPHSPTPYLIDRAVRWGDMSLGDVMSDLTKGGASLQQAMHLLGIYSSADSD